MEQSTKLANILPLLNIGDISHSIINQTTHTETLVQHGVNK